MTSLLSSMLSVNVKPPTTVLDVARSVFITGKVSVLELMRLLKLRSQPRPFYLIAHRCNDYLSVKKAVDLGANAIECDIQFSDDEFEFAVNHDTDDYSSRDAIRTYLRDVAKLLKEHPKVAMFYFDIKEADVNKAKRLRDVIREHLTAKVPDLHIVMAQPDFADRGFFGPIKDDVRAREGFTIDMDNDPVRVSAFFEQLGVERYGYGNGIAVVGGGENIPPSIMKALALKWSERKIRWVYVWTLRSQFAMSNYLAMGVDGIMVNHEDIVHLKNIVEQDGSQRVRFATRDDDPFGPSVHPSYILTVKTPHKIDAGTNANLRFVLRGSKGAAETTINSGPTFLFEQGNINFVTLIGKDVGTIQDLILSQDGSGTGPDWFVDTVKVQKGGSTAVVATFKFSQEILKNQPVTRNPV